MSRIAAEAGATCSDDMSTQVVSFPEAQVAKRLDVLGIAVEADVIISVPKLKTHGLATMTCAVKNMFGTVPGLSKMLYHAKWPDMADFAQMLLDVHQRRPPELALVDGIWGMDGNGPSAGDPRPVGVILAADDGIAADLVASKIAGIDLQRIPTLTAAIGRGLIAPDLSDIELSGAPLEQVAADPPFALPATATHSRRGVLSRVSQVLPLHALSAYPVANARCIGCGTCARACPAEAISIVDRVARMDLDICIRCYCCHELCPHDAIDLKKGLLARLFSGR
jgi:ferredoxin